MYIIQQRSRNLKFVCLIKRNIKKITFKLKCVSLFLGVYKDIESFVTNDQSLLFLELF